jgi:hypothetical protein
MLSEKVVLAFALLGLTTGSTACCMTQVTKTAKAGAKPVAKDELPASNSNRPSYAIWTKITAPDAPVVAGALSVGKTPDAFTIRYGGSPGIPSWRAVLLKKDGGNLSALYVPAESTTNLSGGKRSWPLSVVQTYNKVAVGSLTKGRENFSEFEVAQFELVEQSPQKIVVRSGGPSPTKHFDQQRTFTFTARGVAIAGTVTPLIPLTGVGFRPRWDHAQIQDDSLKVRTQGAKSWTEMASSGSDSGVPLPAGVTYPLEAELQIKRPKPTFLHLFFDERFAGLTKDEFIHNNKEGLKLTCMNTRGPIAPGQTQSYKVRFELSERTL